MYFLMNRVLIKSAFHSYVWKSTFAFTVSDFLCDFKTGCVRNYTGKDLYKQHFRGSPACWCLIKCLEQKHTLISTQIKLTDPIYKYIYYTVEI